MRILAGALVCCAVLAGASCRHGNREPLPPAVTACDGIPDRWPVDTSEPIISSGFGPRVSRRGSAFHKGIDIVVPVGTSVYATARGTTLVSGVQRGYGEIVVLGHDGGIETAYAHLERRSVKAGQRVEKGACIGKSGMTGNATGPHLHYEVRVNGAAVDPRGWLPGR